ncbi:hypothetical protein BST81_20405 [Leptolyngbya sp. 'hensonii']|uniref:DUF2278 family protein n=1 Tax=Leptolyngbya sp. 'hensonii' TaxID=1922337 RepID=UPI00094FDF62|nr:DUF2278 family protein [Leptolyngbya sp. 'hensonii']OLP16562.1 hypothetical protein BST81_20405 [Leptolyngbya sp. 'hensonii']
MKNYGVLKGIAVKYERDDDKDPHSELLMNVKGVSYRIAINVRSSRGPVHQRLVEYLIMHDIKHPIVDRARELPEGWNDLEDGIKDGAAIDYIRSNIFRATDMKPITHFAPGPNNDLFEHVEDLLQRAIHEDGAVVYAFGERWGPEQNKQDAYFGFLPGNGVHLIHMNQGGTGENHGTFHDGALIIDFPKSGTASALFLKFQNQIWHTDEGTATPIVHAPTVPVVPIPGSGTIEPWPVVASDSPYHLARIIAAMVNPRSEDPGREFVTILNIADQALDLTGWQILDKQDKADTLSGSLQPGEAAIFRLSGKGAQLSNKGGTITLLDSRGLKVDGVAYTKDEAKAEGKPIVFS